MAVISMGEPPSPSLRRTPAKQQQPQSQQRSELTHISPNTGRINSPSNKRTRMKASMSRGVAATDDTADITEADENRDPSEGQERPMGAKASSRKHRHSSQPPLHAAAEMRMGAVASTSAVPYDATNAIDQAENTHRRKRRRKGVLHGAYTHASTT